MHAYFDLIEKYNMNETEKKLLNEVYLELEAAQTDCARAEAILDGDWPSAWEYLIRGIERCLNKDKEA
jgi:hypothetical protein